MIFHDMPIFAGNSLNYLGEKQWVHVNTMILDDLDF